MTSLLDNLETFSLHLAYKGPDPAKHRSLYLSVGEPPETLPEACLDIRLSREQAAVLVGALAGNGVLERGQLLRWARLGIPQGPHYALSIVDATGYYYFGYIPLETDSPGMRRPALEQFQSLRAGLVGEAAEAIDQLVQALASDQEQPEASDLQSMGPPTLTRTAIASLLDHLETFRFSLTYKGPDPEKHRSLYLSVAPPPETLPETWLKAELTVEQAAALIGYLACDVFYRGSINRAKRLRSPIGPHYIVTATNGRRDAYFEFIPWTTEPYRWHGDERPRTLEQFIFLRGGLIGDAAEAIDALLRALAPEQEWRIGMDPGYWVKPVPATQEAVASLKDSLETFNVYFEHHGGDYLEHHGGHSRHKSLYLSVAEPPETLPADCLKVRISRKQAIAVIESLAETDYFYRATLFRVRGMRGAGGRFYFQRVSDGQGDDYFTFIVGSDEPDGWRPPGPEKFHAVRRALTGNAAEAMDELLDALAPSQENSPGH
ncbi:hypothetical protein LCGC14_0181950 [marine sediment metagenome]|uniref:Uncharacterized protein n=1 Tax=marine sediment metagenome TaxID=412755 RepID=A0A0F9X829_9ZZZZ|nr:hypothetical protein [Phycisphaerae bacterium]HDZ43094.1 hypothetical protein [Phycisphaerae bacterium]